MSTITLILEPDADGTLHLPVPAELRHGKIEVTATLKPLLGEAGPVPNASPGAIERRMAALARVRALDPYRGIADPVRWQREIRDDHPLPGRE
jgi:hypothetical protein